MDALNTATSAIAKLMALSTTTDAPLTCIDTSLPGNTSATPSDSDDDFDFDGSSAVTASTPLDVRGECVLFPANCEGCCALATDVVLLKAPSHLIKSHGAVVCVRCCEHKRNSPRGKWK